MGKSLNIYLIAAARPNFMKVAPLYHVLARASWAQPSLVHTGQHYDVNMSDSFFADLNLPEPDFHLGVGSGTHAEQTAKVMIAFEQLCFDKRPDLVIVVGDVNSTVACSLVTAKLGIKTAHLEAGLRSFDRTMPEELNRLVTDTLADYLWTPSVDGDENLLSEGVAKEKIACVGNIMIDSLEMIRDKIEAENTFQKLDLPEKAYGVITLHRPANVDDPDILNGICESLIEVSALLPLAFPIHPRTKKTLESSGTLATLEAAPGICLLGPTPYREFMNLLFHSQLVITDSGGIQEETTYLSIPCLTLRPNTERPITITQGTNKLSTAAELLADVKNILAKDSFESKVPELWDGQTAERVKNEIAKTFGLSEA